MQSGYSCFAWCYEFWIEDKNIAYTQKGRDDYEENPIAVTRFHDDSSAWSSNYFC